MPADLQPPNKQSAAYSLASNSRDGSARSASPASGGTLGSAAQNLSQALQESLNGGEPYVSIKNGETIYAYEMTWKQKAGESLKAKPTRPHFNPQHECRDAIA